MIGTLDPVLFNIAIILFSLVIIFYASNLLVLGITRYSRKLGMSDYFSGLIVVAIGASAPEMITAIIGISMKNTDLAFGTILGSNMVHMALLTGIFIIAGRKMKNPTAPRGCAQLLAHWLGAGYLHDKRLFSSMLQIPAIHSHTQSPQAEGYLQQINIKQALLEKTKLIMWVLLLLPLALSLDGTLSRIDGGLLILSFIAYLFFVSKKEHAQGKLKKKIELKHIWKDGAVFLGSLIALLLAGRWLVFSSVQLADIAEIPVYLVALILLGIGGAIPDLAVELRSLFTKHQSIGIGDAIGSTMLELLLFFGIVALIQPISVSLGTIANAAFWLYASITTVFLFLNRKKTYRWQGVLLVLFYVGFVAIEIMHLR